MSGGFFLSVPVRPGQHFSLSEVQDVLPLVSGSAGTSVSAFPGSLALGFLCCHWFSFSFSSPQTRLRRQDAGLKTHLDQLDLQISELQLGMCRASGECPDSDSRPSSGTAVVQYCRNASRH